MNSPPPFITKRKADLAFACIDDVPYPPHKRVVPASRGVPYFSNGKWMVERDIMKVPSVQRVNIVTMKMLSSQGYTLTMKPDGEQPSSADFINVEVTRPPTPQPKELRCRDCNEVKVPGVSCLCYRSLGVYAYVF